MAARTTRQTSKERGVASQRQPEGSDSEARELTLADIQQDIRRSSSDVCAKIDSLSAEVASINNKISQLEDSVSMNSDKLIDLEQTKIPELENKMADEISKLQEKLTAMEIYCRRMNLLFYGVQETQNENVEVSLRNTFSLLGIPADEAANFALVNVHRLPRRQAATPGQASGNLPRPDPTPRAIIAKFVYMRDRNKVLAAFEEQQRQRQRQPHSSEAAPDHQPRRITVRTDLPPALKAKRSALAKTAYELRKEKNLSTKISVVGTKVLLHWKERGAATWNLFRD